MRPRAGRGRPQATSRETIAEAAGELFLEQGYADTSVRDIAQRAGVSRSSFFNYFDSKAATIWFQLDEHIDALCGALRTADAGVPDAISAFHEGAVPQQLLLAITNAEAMGVVDELQSGRAARQLQVAEAITGRVRRETRDGDFAGFSAEVVGAGYAGALFAAVWRWAELGAGRVALASVLDEALSEARALLSSAHPIQ